MVRKWKVITILKEGTYAAIYNWHKRKFLPRANALLSSSFLLSLSLLCATSVELAQWFVQVRSMCLSSFFVNLFFFFFDLPLLHKKHRLVPVHRCGQIQPQCPTVSDRVPFCLRFATLAGPLNLLSSAWGRGCDMLLLFVACIFVLPMCRTHGWLQTTCSQEQVVLCGNCVYAHFHFLGRLISQTLKAQSCFLSTVRTGLRR